MRWWGRYIQPQPKKCRSYLSEGVDCRQFHIGHADKSQINCSPVAITKEPGLAEDLHHGRPAVRVPSMRHPMPEERRLAAKQSGNPNVYCSSQCKRKCGNRASISGETREIGRAPDFLKRMRDK